MLSYQVTLHGVPTSGQVFVVAETDSLDVARFVAQAYGQGMRSMGFPEAIGAIKDRTGRFIESY